MQILSPNNCANVNHRQTPFRIVTINTSLLSNVSSSGLKSSSSGPISRLPVNKLHIYGPLNKYMYIISKYTFTTVLLYRKLMNSKFFLRNIPENISWKNAFVSSKRGLNIDINHNLTYALHEELRNITRAVTRLVQHMVLLSLPLTFH